MMPAAALPRYGSGSLADVLPSALAVLGLPGPDPIGLRPSLDGVRRIAVLLVDGLGWHQFRAAGAAPHAPSLVSLAAAPASRELTTAFPSTTPVSLVTVGTGQPPGAHGIIGFTVRIPDTTRLLTHIHWANQPDPSVWQPVPTAFDRAAAGGLRCTVVSRAEFQGTGLTVAAYRGAGFRPAGDPVTLAAEMIAALDSNALVYGYHPELDSAGHQFGAGSPEWLSALRVVDALVSELVNRLPADAALLVTADHGMLNIPWNRRFDIDADPRLKAGIRMIAGEPRVRYLHVVPGARDDVLSAWRSVLGDAAWVVSRDEAVAAGWFGPVDPAHLARIGDVVVACEGDAVVLSSATEPDRVARLVGYHGSFSPAEMIVPLLVARRA
jgi:hypothetical protein